MNARAVENVTRWSDGMVTLSREELAVEEPLEIRVRGRGISITMRTPGHDEELAAGFLLTEAVIRSRSDILDMQPCTKLSEDGEPTNVLNVLLAPDVAIDFSNLTRHVFSASSCGICGKSSIESVRTNFPPIQSDVTVSIHDLLTLPGKMRESQKMFDATGGIHAAALFDRHGSLIVAREDVGRHNAVDKVIGHAMLASQRPDVLMVSGRTSFEILQKALAARVPIIAAVSAPSSLAVQFAHEMGQTLIGFLRDRRMNIYTHPSRIQL
jgi:FdhD protein